MDPLSQGTLGAIASQNLTNKQLGLATLLGFLSGITADLDIFIRSDTDPLLFLEYHRQFTHSLIFIPLGGLICAMIFFIFIKNKRQISFKQTYLFCTAAYATHALLDSCTSYGTQLFWPFSDYRVSWNIISIIDPLFTLPLLFLIVMALVHQNQKYARVALIWVIVYLCFGLTQKERALTAANELALSRNHQPVRIEVKPGFANLILWKATYEYDNKFYVDGIRVGFKSSTYQGTSIAKLNINKDFPWLKADSQQARDLKRFSWFSDGFVALHPENPKLAVDIRYSLIPNQIDPLWMIELDQAKTQQQHVGYYHRHNRDSQVFRRLWQMLKGQIAKQPQG